MFDTIKAAYQKFVMYVKPCAIGLLTFFLALTAPLLVLLALPFIKWDKEATMEDESRYSLVRGDLPKWLDFLSTPDERLPGGIYEPAVAAIYAKYGATVCSWYWLGLRNRMHGLDAKFGIPTDKDWDGPFSDDEYFVRAPLWWRRKPIFGGKFAFKAGYRFYTVLDKSILAVPCFTITKK